MLDQIYNILIGYFDIPTIIILVMIWIIALIYSAINNGIILGYRGKRYSDLISFVEITLVSVAALIILKFLIKKYLLMASK